MLKEKLKYFFANNFDNKVFSTSDETLFLHKQDAKVHSSTLEDNDVLEHLRSDSKESIEPGKKLSLSEYKELKANATAEYKELFGNDPDSKLSGKELQKLNDAKKAEIANQQNPE